MSAGVIQPAQGLSRGKSLRSITTTSRPEPASFQAHDEPAGPPPTIKTSQRSMSVYPVGRSVVIGHMLNLVLIDAGARPGNRVVLARSEKDLKELQMPRTERGLRGRQVQPPAALEALVEHLPHSTGCTLEPLQPVFQRFR